MFTKCVVEIGDALWTALYSYLDGAYDIESICEEEGQKFAIIVANDVYYRLNFSFSDEGQFETLGEISALEEYSPDGEPQFDPAAIAEYAKSLEKDEVKEEEEDNQEEKCPKCGKPKSECKCEEEEKEEDKKEKYNLEEIQEYVELSDKYSKLEADYNEMASKMEALENQLTELTAFKAAVDKAEKEKMIDSFYMLSDEDKKDVVANIDTYSLEDIEAKLSIICVRNKVSFNLDEDKSNEPTIYHLNGDISDDTGVPAWIKAVRSVAADM